MANQNQQSDVNTEGYGSSVTFTGRVVTKRLFTTKTGKHVLNLFVRTKTARGKLFGIGTTIWGDEAQAIGAVIDEAVPHVKEGDLIQEADAPVVTVVGEMNEDSWDDKSGNKQRRFNVNAFEITVDG